MATEVATETRDTSKLADGYEQHLLSNGGKANLVCVSEDEATLLAKELRKRGWKAKEEQGLQGPELKLINYVRVSGRKKERR